MKNTFNYQLNPGHYGNIYVDLFSKLGGWQQAFGIIMPSTTGGAMVLYTFTACPPTQQAPPFEGGLEA